LRQRAYEDRQEKAELLVQSESKVAVYSEHVEKVA
jgi:hypothetical protein